MSDRNARRALDRMYARLPILDCQGKCAESCGPIVMSRVEWTRMIDAGGERHGDESLTCPYLEGERCSVYAVRPTICRLWGMVEAMPCEWGCQPTRMLGRDEGYAFLREAERIGA